MYKNAYIDVKNVYSDVKNMYIDVSVNVFIRENCYVTTGIDFWGR
jgi:hypothetical protein